MKRWITPFAAVAMLLAPPVQAQVTDVTVEVDGLACPFCAYGLEKKLRDIEGVAELVIDVQAGTATLIPGEGETIALQSVPAAVTDAGFTPREVRVHAHGRIRTIAEQPTLVSAEGTALFALEANEVLTTLAPDDETAYAVSGVIVADGDRAAALPLLALSSAAPRTTVEGS